MIDIDCECAELPLRSYPAGDVLLPEGGCTGKMYFLVEGEVEVSRGGVVVGRLDERGAVLGEISVLLGRPHIAEVRTVVPSSFRVAEDAEAYLRAHPEVNLCIARSLAAKVDAMSCYVVDLKRQYADEAGHLGMVGDVLEELLQQR